MDRDSHEYKVIEDNLVDTLRAFVDPFDRESDEDKIIFRYEIKAFEKEFWRKGTVKEILNYTDVFDYKEFSKLEHKVEGKIDEKGWFRGTVTAFGVEYQNVEIPCRVPGMAALTQAGMFEVKIGTFEFEISKSTHEKATHDLLLEQARQYSGFMIFRDGLRVLPYGKSNNDFFEIEERRGMNKVDPSVQTNIHLV